MEVSGSPTEKAILQWGLEVVSCSILSHRVLTIRTIVDPCMNHFWQLGLKFDAVKSESIILHVSPFNSTKKRGGVAVRGQVIYLDCMSI